ncbi:MAG: adenosine-specific kinase [Anaerolineae bacterium]
MPSEITLELKLVTVEKPDNINVIVGQSHFIKTVEDLHEALVTAVPGIKFGLAFCEASGDALVRWSGTSDAMIQLAQETAQALDAGHAFVIFLDEGYYPVNVLNAIKVVPEVARIFCATANPLQVVIAESEQGRGILGVIDGMRTQGLEGEKGIAWRKNLLRTIGYKL